MIYYNNSYKYYIIYGCEQQRQSISIIILQCSSYFIILNQLIIITINSNMRARKAQITKRNQSGIKSAIERAKPSRSTNKKLIQTHSSHLKILPSVGKQLENDKQNVDIAQSALKLLSVAGSNRQKQILLSLASQMEKQNKLKVVLAKKQFTSDLSELQSMLNHLKQQQIKQLSSLKIQIGKRKLHSLDEHDLRQDILNLNSYVMRRSKRDTMILKDQGVDLIAEIYSKFDEQQRLIFDLSSKDKNIRKIKQNRSNIYINESPNCSSNIVQIQNYHLLDNMPQSQITVQDKKSLTQNRDLMQKILKLQKQNLRLMKQIKKIQQQFECVVEQKLLLQQKYERSSHSQKLAKRKFTTFAKLVRENIYQLKQLYLLNSQQIYEVANQFTLQFQQIKQQIKQYMEREKYYGNSIMQCENSVNSNQYQHEFIGQGSSNDVVTSISSQNQMIDNYVQIITQKQIQINQYLKTIKNHNQRFNAMKGQFQQFKAKYNQTNQKIKCKIKAAFLQTIKIKNSYITDVNQIKQFVKSQVTNFIFTFHQKYQQNKQQYQNTISALVTEKQDCYLQIYEKQKQISRNQQRIKQLQLQLDENINKLQTQNTQSERDKEKLIQNINLIKDRLKLEEQKVNEVNFNMINLTKALSEVKQESINAKHSFLIQFNQLAQLHSQQINKLNKNINIMKQEINKLTININYLQSQKIKSQSSFDMQFNSLKHEKEQILQEFRQIQQKYRLMELKNNQLISYINSKQKQRIQISNQYERFKDTTISQCSMILQSKNQQITKIRQTLNRQIMKKEDLEAFIIEQNSNPPKNIEKQFIQRTKKIMLQIKQNLLIIKQNQKKVKDDLKKVVQVFQECSLQLAHKCHSESLTQYNFLQLQNFNQNKPLTLETFKNIASFSYIPQKNYLDFISLYQKIYFDVGICGSIDPQIENLSVKDFHDKISTMREFLVSQKDKQIAQKAQVSKLQKKYQQENEQSKSQIKQQNKFQNCQFNNIQARSPQIQQKNKNEESKMSVQSLFQGKSHQNIADQFLNINTMDILDQSIIQVEISALRVELAQSFKVNQKIMEELKFYQQKDMDKIFDF